MACLQRNKITVHCWILGSFCQIVVDFWKRCGLCGFWHQIYLYLYIVYCLPPLHATTFCSSRTGFLDFGFLIPIFALIHVMLRSKFFQFVDVNMIVALSGVYRAVISSILLFGSALCTLQDVHDSIKFLK